MLYALLSPAKRLDFDSHDDLVAQRALKATRPALKDDNALLATRTKRLTIADLKRLMDISPALATLNHARFQALDTATTKAAIYAFAGDVYQGFDAASLGRDDIAYAQEHIGILSGFYGLLRPLDAIAPYRLEMGTKLKTERGRDLYAFWRAPLTARLNAVTAKMADATVINLASAEYWGAVDESGLRPPVIHAAFKEIKGGKAQIVSFLAKKARGLMARYIVEHRVEIPEGLKGFDTAGYRYDAAASSANTWVFSRKST